MQHGLALPRPAGEMAGSQVALDLPDMAAHRLDASGQAAVRN